MSHLSAPRPWDLEFSWRGSGLTGHVGSTRAERLRDGRLSEWSVNSTQRNSRTEHWHGKGSYFTFTMHICIHLKKYIHICVLGLPLSELTETLSDFCILYTVWCGQMCCLLYYSFTFSMVYEFYDCFAYNSLPHKSVWLTFFFWVPIPIYLWYCLSFVNNSFVHKLTMQARPVF